MIRRIISFFVFALLSVFAFASNHPKREMRAVWIATVANIDWPSSKSLSVEQQKRELVVMLDKFKESNINTVIFQARPSADAFYESETEPWSMWLTGTPGKRPEPYYDPLAFLINEAHKRAMELHVWVNPYRALNYADTAKFAPNHLFRKHPEYFIKYSGKYYFDPGLKETRDYLSKVIAEIVVKYDIDAVVFDDYFYPYPTGEKFDDSKSYATDKRGFENVADWRRDNVNIAIKRVSDTIRSLKPWVQFGISPFGVWRHSTSDKRGSESFKALTNYDDLYADVLYWTDNDMLDYVSPQLYWEIGKKRVDYKMLLPWWSKNVSKANLYISMYSSGFSQNRKNKAWQRPNELCRQLRLNRKDTAVHGAMYYSAKYFVKNELGFNDSIRSTYYKYPAIVPASQLLKDTDSLKSTQIQDLKFNTAREGQRRTYSLTWSAVNDTLGRQVSYYVVYRFAGKKIGDTSDPKNIVAITSDPNVRLKYPGKGKYTYAVTSVNRYRIESELSNAVVAKYK